MFKYVYKPIDRYRLKRCDDINKYYTSGIDGVTLARHYNNIIQTMLMVGGVGNE